MLTKQQSETSKKEGVDELHAVPHNLASLLQRTQRFVTQKQRSLKINSR
jgi:hypothetical protein